MNDEDIGSLDPDDRDWEYAGDGTKIYKLKHGFGTMTPWDGGEKLKDSNRKWHGVEEPYYVDLP
jgi:hypothetical protein